MNIVKLKNKEGEEIFPITSSKAVFDEKGESVYQSQKDLEGKASQVYENFAAIEGSGETNVNKIYIDGDTLIPYIYNGEEFTYLNSVKPKGGYNRALFEAAGAVFNEDTGYYELNGITDITENEMYLIYNNGNLNNGSPFKGKLFYSVGGRTNIPYSSDGNSPYNILKTDYFCFENQKIQNLVLGIICSLNDSYSFSRNKYLKSIKKLNTGHNEEYGDIIIQNSFTNYSNLFYGDDNLEEVYVKGISKSCTIFNVSTKINYNSIKYLVDNASNKSQITLTINPTTYGYLTGTIQPTEQVGGTTEEWQAIVTTAAEKQITFATTE